MCWGMIWLQGCPFSKNIRGSFLFLFPPPDRYPLRQKRRFSISYILLGSLTRSFVLGELFRTYKVALLFLSSGHNWRALKFGSFINSEYTEKWEPFNLITFKVNSSLFVSERNSVFLEHLSPCDCCRSLKHPRNRFRLMERRPVNQEDDHLMICQLNKGVNTVP